MFTVANLRCGRGELTKAFVESVDTVQYMKSGQEINKWCTRCLGTGV